VTSDPRPGAGTTWWYDTPAAIADVRTLLNERAAFRAELSRADDATRLLAGAYARIETQGRASERRVAELEAQRNGMASRLLGTAVKP
jgi:hypothetical protein